MNDPRSMEHHWSGLFTRDTLFGLWPAQASGAVAWRSWRQDATLTSLTSMS